MEECKAIEAAKRAQAKADADAKKAAEAEKKKKEADAAAAEAAAKAKTPEEVATDAQHTALLNREKAIKQSIAALVANDDPEAIEEKAVLQARLKECQHMRTLLKPVEDRVVAMKQHVITCEKLWKQPERKQRLSSTPLKLLWLKVMLQTLSINQLSWH